ncbi:Uncharacterised protein [Porphyromonas macacae]|uniref:Uncharacterized protein n=1 Tax=Porphyromonas macacae TaxID=28115 RepID=A0A379E9E3_9PORP|nr:hypothetical protein [Porphyromonas macacae]SUB89285.1 Uncharacterised protein [Porphyromonas macacae]
MEKMRDFQFFMTEKDERAFCETLRNFNHNIYFLDTKPSFESDINKRLVTDITKLSSEFFSIVNLEFISKEELGKCYKIRSGYYHFFQLGRAQMQFLRSHPDKYTEGCLQYGRIADSYETEDEEEKKWKNSVYGILKKMGQKVYWYYILPDGKREISTKPQNKLVALPDAIGKYDGKLGNFMLYDKAKFVPKGVNVVDLD